LVRAAEVRNTDHLFRYTKRLWRRAGRRARGRHRAGARLCSVRARYSAGTPERHRVSNPWPDGDRAMSLGSCDRLTWW